jgi:hypothetical protein
LSNTVNNCEEEREMGRYKEEEVGIGDNNMKE